MLLLEKVQKRRIDLAILETNFEFTFDKNTNCYDEPSYEPDPEPEQQPSQGGNTWTDADAQARAEGFADAASKKSFEEYKEKYYPGSDLHLATDEELKDWGIVIDW